MIVIDLARARDVLAEAVRTQGRDFVYNPNWNHCYYRPMAVDRDTGRDLAFDDPRLLTGCLIGTALKLAGVPDRALEALEGARISGPTTRMILADRGVRLESDAQEYFAVAQRQQDRGLSWGEAYDAAEASLKAKVS